MKRVLLGIGTTALVLSVAGCRGIFSSDERIILHVTEAAAPASVPPGSAVSVVLTVQTGGCKRFDRIETQASASVATITVWGRDSRDGACTADVRYESHTVRFEPPFASTFRINVMRGAFNPLVLTVEVRPL